MHPLTVVIAQADPVIAEHLAAKLHTHFKNVIVARNLDEIRHHVQRNFADIVIVDLELTGPAELQHIVEDYRYTGVICTHRAPDEEMWRRCLELGALDCCYCGDVHGIVHAARRHPPSMTSAAA